MEFNWKQFKADIIRKSHVKTPLGLARIPLKELAEKCGVPSPTLHRVSVRGKKADIDTVIKICAGFKLDYNDYVIEGKPTKVKS